MKDKTLQIFFLCAGASMVIASLRVATNFNTIKQFITDWFITVMTILFTGATSGAAAMIGFVFAQRLKKNLNYECQNNRRYSRIWL